MFLILQEASGVLLLIGHIGTDSQPTYKLNKEKSDLIRKKLTMKKTHLIQIRYKINGNLSY